jgi:carboxyl-terminal processing protease
MLRRGAWIAAGLLCAGVVALSSSRLVALRTPAVSNASVPGVRPAASDTEGQPAADEPRSRPFRVPAGHAPSLSCDAARAIVAQARDQLGYVPAPVDARALSEAAADWLDPYGLWTVAPDAPVSGVFNRRASALLADLEGPSKGCETARAIGESLAAWTAELRVVFDDECGRIQTGGDVLDAASSTAFEGATVTRPARALAATLGRRIGIIERELGVPAKPYVDAARERYFPALDGDGWAGVVLAATVRAYVPAIDPHGAWAPIDEESSVYEIDLEARPPGRLWEKADRTAIGIKIDSGAAPPLADGDVVLSLAGVATAGLSYEQVEQLGYATSDARPAAQAVVLREGERLPVVMALQGAGADPKAAAANGDDAGDLPVERIEFGDGDVIVITIHDVRDDLGDELTRAILHERQREGRSIAGVVLDLRGNGGGSTDGAIDALGLFLPGASLFPMKRRDGTIETDRAPEPPNVDRWASPVATLVDGDTASAAEMLAGALASYRRGPMVGATTFGKGCAQEYIDDDIREGVLRLTTLLYALPDGTPVQRVGLTPNVHFPFGTDPSDREVSLPHAPPSWRGPDVRDRAVLAHVDDGTWTTVWPPNGGNVGPCKDADVCRSLRLLGASAPTARRSTRGAPKKKGY